MIFNLLNRLKDDAGLNIIALSFNEGELSEKLRSAGIETYIIPEYQHSFISIIFKALRICKGRNIDIIHSHRFKENVLALLLARFLGIRQLFVTLHGLPEPTFRKKRGLKSAKIKTYINHFLLKTFFTEIVSVSREMETILVQKYYFKKESVHVIHNGIPIPPDDQQVVDLQCHKPNNKDRDIHIGTVGRLVPIKDFALFLEIAAAVKQKINRVRFSILGDGPLKEHLQARAAQLHVLDFVDFRSPMINPFPYYYSLDIYLNTSIHEGIPLSILEAMVCGKAVIAPSVGGITEIITNGKSGLLVADRRASVFVDYCIRLINDNKYRDSIAANARKHVILKFSDVDMANSYSMLYSQRVK